MLFNYYLINLIITKDITVKRINPLLTKVQEHEYDYNKLLVLLKVATNLLYKLSKTQPLMNVLD